MYAVRVLDLSAPAKEHRPIRALRMLPDDGPAQWFRSFELSGEEEPTLSLEDAVKVAMSLASAGDHVRVLKLDADQVLLDTDVRVTLVESTWVERFIHMMSLLSGNSPDGKLTSLARDQFRLAPHVWPEFRAWRCFRRRREAGLQDVSAEHHLD